MLLRPSETYAVNYTFYVTFQTIIMLPAVFSIGRYRKILIEIDRFLIEQIFLIGIWIYFNDLYVRYIVNNVNEILINLYDIKRTFSTMYKFDFYDALIGLKLIYLVYRSNDVTQRSWSLQFVSQSIGYVSKLRLKIDPINAKAPLFNFLKRIFLIVFLSFQI